MHPDALSEKYVGDLARKYDDDRKRRPAWIAEDEIVGRILSGVPIGSTVIDVPVGTGRFAPHYKKYGLKVVGVDMSGEMLSIAEEKARELDLDWQLSIADIRRLPWSDGAFDVSVCIRMFQWFSAIDLQAALKDLARVTRGLVVFGAPTYMPFGEIASVKDFKRYLLQRKLKFYHWRTSSDLLCHEAEVITSALERAGLQLIEKYPIHEKKHEYAIYVAGPISGV